MKNIIVCVKQVPDTTEIRLDPVKGTLIREGVPSIMNPDDKAGLEAALRLKDQLGSTITVITMGPPQADEVLKEALAMGADRAILLTDMKFAGADTLATATALAGAVRKLDYDLVITGRQAIDGDTAQVGPEMAEFLDLPQISYTAGIVAQKDGSFLVDRKVEDRIYRLKVRAPFLVTVLAEGYQPRYMHVAKLLEAYREPKIEKWTAADLDVDPANLGLKGSPTKVNESYSKALKSEGKVYELDPAEAAKLIAEKLHEKYVL